MVKSEKKHPFTECLFLFVTNSTLSQAANNPWFLFFLLLPTDFVWFDRVFGAVKRHISSDWDPFGQ